MKKLYNITRNTCFVLVLCYLGYHALRIFQPDILEEYLILNHDIPDDMLSIASIESYSSQNEIPVSTIPKKIILTDGSHHIFFHPDDLIRIDRYEGISTLYLTNSQQLQIGISLDEIMEKLKDNNISNHFWQNPSNIFNLNYITEIKSINVSEIPPRDSTHLKRKIDYRTSVTFSDLNNINLRKDYKKELDSILHHYISNTH